MAEDARTFGISYFIELERRKRKGFFEPQVELKLKNIVV